MQVVECSPIRRKRLRLNNLLLINGNPNKEKEVQQITQLVMDF